MITKTHKPLVSKLIPKTKHIRLKHVLPVDIGKNRVAEHTIAQNASGKDTET